MTIKYFLYKYVKIEHNIIKYLFWSLQYKLDQTKNTLSFKTPYIREMH